MKSQVVKRSVVLDGHKTSITLEDAFWSTLKEIAQAQGATVSQTVTEIDKSRKGVQHPVFNYGAPHQQDERDWGNVARMFIRCPSTLKNPTGNHGSRE